MLIKGIKIKIMLSSENKNDYYKKKNRYSDNL